MTKMINLLSSMATLAMAATAISAIAPAAQAAEVHIQITDLDLSNPTDAARFQQRIDAAASRLCNVVGASLDNRESCRAAVREEAVDKLGGVQQRNLQLAMARTVRSERQSAGF
ncbi:MAG: UrcA family protein [Caulobacteraceae bacterium]